MNILSKDECADWAKRYKIALDERLRPFRCNNAPHRLWAKIPSSFSRVLWVMRQIESSLNIDSQCLVWVTDWGIFPSNENMQLFYRFRQSYGNNKLLSEAPGHLCLPNERDEIVSLIWLCALQGWDVHVMPDTGSSSIFISHDEWFELGYTDLDNCVEGQKRFAESKLELQLKKPVGTS